VGRSLLNSFFFFVNRGFPQLKGQDACLSSQRICLRAAFLTASNSSPCPIVPTLRVVLKCSIGLIVFSSRIPPSGILFPESCNLYARAKFLEGGGGGLGWGVGGLGGGGRWGGGGGGGFIASSFTFLPPTMIFPSFPFPPIPVFSLLFPIKDVRTELGPLFSRPDTHFFFFFFFCPGPGQRAFFGFAD